MSPTSLAEETSNFYLSHIDEFSPHAENVNAFLKGPTLFLTKRLVQEEQQDETWKEFLKKMTETTGADVDELDPRSLARMNAFLESVSLAMPSDDPPVPRKTSLFQQGLSFQSSEPASLIRSISTNSSATPRPQISFQDLATRLQLYIRTVQRSQENMIANEPIRPSKVRAMSVVSSFVETVSTVQEQGPVLTRLLSCMTREVLAVPVLGKQAKNAIQRLVSDYEHTTSFASLAFLSSPEAAADSKLMPMVWQYLKYLRLNSEQIHKDCCLEAMLQRTLDPALRKTFQTVEFRSIGHLLEVCHEFRSELQEIHLAPPDEEVTEKHIQQALTDMRREIITVNGRVLPPVHSRSELIQILSQTLNSESLTASSLTRRRRNRDRMNKSRGSVRGSSQLSSPENSDYSLSSGNEGDSELKGSRRKFQISTIDSLTKRLLLAGCRTGIGGDSFFIVRDFFGDDDVEVVQSAAQSQSRRETIEIVVRLASITISCHGSFDVYPKSLVGNCEPLIQVRTTTQERISLKEIRVGGSGENELQSPTQVQELVTDKTGWRTLSIRPALYERVQVFNTPS